MTSWIAVFERGSDEYCKLLLTAALLEAKSPNGYHYKVDETYFDLGQGWKWTTVICEGDSWGGYQALCPAEQKRVLESNGSIEELMKIVNSVLTDKYCPDRIKQSGGD